VPLCWPRPQAVNISHNILFLPPPGWRRRWGRRRVHWFRPVLSHIFANETGSSELKRWNVVFSSPLHGLDGSGRRSLFAQAVDQSIPTKPNHSGHLWPRTPEIIREGATMIMLAASAGSLPTWRARFAIGSLPSGVGPLLLRFLRMLIAGPHVVDWDVLFLIPLPCGACPRSHADRPLMVVFGTLIVRLIALWPSPKSVATSAAGVGIVLWHYVQRAGIDVSRCNFEIIRDSLPQSFPWLLFCQGSRSWLFRHDLARS